MIQNLTKLQKMRALFLLGAEKMKDEVGCYVCYFPFICEI